MVLVSAIAIIIFMTVFEFAKPKGTYSAGTDTAIHFINLSTGADSILLKAMAVMA